MHASIAITLYQVRPGDPSFPPAHGPTGLPVATCSLYLALGLREVVPQALESVKGSLICKFWERTQRILKAYWEGAVFGDAAYTQQVYRSHRRVHNSG